MGPEDFEAWEPQEPPRDFAERVVGQAMVERRAAGKARAGRIVAGAVVVAAMAAAVAVTAQMRGAHAHGDVTAAERQEVRVGGRALAVLEKGAHVSWDGDAIAQSGGDVFWRVEPGARFVVHTPSADVAVKGTCFRVNVTGDEGEMNRRDAMSGAAGAVLTAAAFVGVYEGKVAVSHAGQTVDLTAGQSAQASADGVKRVAGASGEAPPVEPAAASGTEGERLLTAANANLADSVRDYRRRLEANEAEKQRLEKQLAEAQARLADGGIPRSEYELTPDDLKALAKDGEVRMRVPCGGPRGDYSPSPETLNKLGLAPQDGPMLQAAYQQSHARTWGVIQPLCSQALGGADVSHIGQQACVSILMNIASEKSPAAYDEDVRQVAEILAGQRPPPAPGAAVDPLMTAYLALARETQNIQSDLSQSIGPDDARRAVFADSGCWWNSSHGVGARKTP
jgi:hypothetical protein